MGQQVNLVVMDLLFKQVIQVYKVQRVKLVLLVSLVKQGLAIQVQQVPRVIQV